MGGQLPAEKDDFFSKKKEDFLLRMQNQGYDLFQIQDWISRFGLLSMDDYILTNNL